METLLLDADKEKDLQIAGEFLREGRLVVFPTETVYGIGARADSESAVRRLYEVKRRNAAKKSTLLIADPVRAEKFAGPFEPEVEQISRSFWPGPLTIVVWTDAGGWTGLRCPDCRPTRRILRHAGVPIMTPSANVSGDPPAKDAREALEIFDGKIVAVVDGGPARIGVSSTVVRVCKGEMEILREGSLSVEKLHTCLKQ
ncbi:MAG: L-threonylcarbamoyladenylate synthase [Candidatus Brocadiia bacterium]